MIPQSIEQKVRLILEHKFAVPVSIGQVKSISGGDINEAACLKTSSGDFFVKWNDSKRYPDMFQAEAKGLKQLKDAGEIYIPEVISTGEAGGFSILILEYVQSAGRINRFMEDFGSSLAMLHKHSDIAFGLDHNNYIGSLPQSNRPHNNWTSFFIEERLEKQVKIARNSGEIGMSTVSSFERLYKELPSVFPDEVPALVHGDLWGGNYITAPDGRACIYDPAVYYGHREMDLGMSKLFGGFGAEFYEAYNQAYPLEKNWQKRTDVCNLYPLMVHVNLFGGSYVYSVQSILRKF
jgi:protein-ribulosamine 3-kinase